MAVNVGLKWFVWWWLFRQGWRWFSGNTWNGKPRTDAGWMRKGVKSVDTFYPHPSRWALMPRFYRAFIRISAFFTPLIVAIAWLLFREWVYRIGTAILLVLLVLIAFWSRKKIRTWKFNHHVIKPFTMLASQVIGQSSTAIERDMKIDMMHHPEEGRVPCRITLKLPPEYDGRQGHTALVRAANARFSGDWEAGVNMRHWPYTISLMRKPDPRSGFTFEELMTNIGAYGGPGKIILGAGTGTEIVVADIIRRFPHIGLSIGTGGGKSSFYRSAIAQLSYWGDDSFDVCDVKWVSLMGLEKVPGLRIHRDVEDIWEATHKLRLTMDERYQEMLDGRENFDAKYLILEEMNAFTMESHIRWEELGGKGKEPFWNDVNLIAFKARQVNIHLFGAWQLLLTIAAGGNSQLRDQLGLKILSRFSPQAWKLLVGQTPVEFSSSIPGRAVAVMDGERKRFQMPLVSVDQAMEMVMKGRAWAAHNGLEIPVTPKRRPSPRKRTAA